MIDEKKIYQATMDYLDEEGCKPYIEKAFQDGTQWAQQEFIKSLWHDASEKPMVNRLIFAIDKTKRIVFDFEFGERDDWAEEFSFYKITHWAYIDDILPKEGGEK